MVHTVSGLSVGALHRKVALGADEDLIAREAVKLGLKMAAFLFPYREVAVDPEVPEPAEGFQLPET